MFVSRLSEEYGSISLLGSKADLNRLYEMVHKICDADELLESGASDWILGLAYEIRKARDGARDHIVIPANEWDEGNDAFGFDYPLCYWLPAIGVIRNLIAYGAFSRDAQALMWSLEHLTFSAISNASNQSVAEELMFICSGFNYQALNLTHSEAMFRGGAYFMSLSKTERLRALPHIIRSLSGWFLKDYRMDEYWPQSYAEAEAIWEKSEA